MKNVTVTMDEDLARWARVKAAEQDMSLSRFLAELVREKMSEDDDYDLAMKTYFAVEPSADSGGLPLPGREERNERPLLRR